MSLPIRADDVAYAYTFGTAAKRLEVSRRTVQRMVAAGELRTITVCGMRRVSHRELQAYLDRQSMPIPIDRSRTAMPARRVNASARG